MRCANLALLVAIFVIVPSALSCGMEYLSDSHTHIQTHRHMLAEAGAPKWNYNRNGDDWTGTCETGKSQSPISFSTTGASGEAVKGISLKFGVASGAKVIHTGHSVQVEWTSLKGNSARIPSRGLWGSSKTGTVALQPFQFHVHSTCEHIVDGIVCPVELHLVTRVDRNASDSPKQCKGPTGNCLAVFGVIHEFTSNIYAKNASALFDAIVKNIPGKVGPENAVNLPLPSVDLGALLPSDKKFAWYSGSLTTPPCSEQVSWHVFPTTRKDISLAHVNAIQQAMATVVEPTEARKAGEAESGARTNNRPPQPLNGRKVQHYDA